MSTHRVWRSTQGRVVTTGGNDQRTKVLGNFGYSLFDRQGLEIETAHGFFDANEASTVANSRMIERDKL